MAGLIECIPNFSEGRSAVIVDQIVAAMAIVPGIHILDCSLNPDHNRAVVTLVGPASAVVEAAFNGIRAARDLIDLRHHQGVHPRIGATDVVPFVPLTGSSLADCIVLARQLGERVARELAIPVYLYEAAASRASRRDLANVRRGQFEELAHTIGASDDRTPDFGPARLHPSAGAIAIGARPPLLAFNVNLRTDDVAVAEALARVVRQQSGGLRSVKALGVVDGGRAQVSMNLTDPVTTPPHRVLALLRAEAERFGVSIAGSEIIGLAPLDSLLAAAEHSLGLNGFRHDQILEWQLLGHTDSGQSAEDDPPDAAVGPYLDALASSKPTPGGGSVAALVGALAAALGEMVANLTVGREKFVMVEERLNAILGELTRARRQLTAAMIDDARAFEAYMAARRLPRATNEERDRRASEIQSATLAAARAPLRVAALSSALLPLLADVAEHGNPTVASDAAVGAVLAEAAVRTAGINVRVDLPGLKDATMRQSIENELTHLEATAGPQTQRIVAHVQAIIAGNLA